MKNSSVCVTVLVFSSFLFSAPQNSAKMQEKKIERQSSLRIPENNFLTEHSSPGSTPVGSPNSVPTSRFAQYMASLIKKTSAK